MFIVLLAGKSATFSDYLKLRKVSESEEVLFKGEVRDFYDKGDQVILKQCEILDKKRVNLFLSMKKYEIFIFFHR